MHNISVSAYAKINLTLDIGKKREDGYHDIRSIMQTIALHDELSISLIPGEQGIYCDVSGPETEGVPTDDSNLAVRAAKLMLQELARKDNNSFDSFACHISIVKNIPSQAGLGGGSSDAAAVMMALDRLFSLQLAEQRLTELAVAIGSDVPFFLVGGMGLAEGRGEQVSPLQSLPNNWDIFIVKPHVHTSTALAYAKLDSIENRKVGYSTQEWLSGNKKLHNDFWVSEQNVPELAAVYKQLDEYPYRMPGMPPTLCGSGSAIFCLVDMGSAEQKIALDTLFLEIYNQQLGKYWLTQTLGRDEWRQSLMQ